MPSFSLSFRRARSSEANQMYTAYQPQTSNNQVRRAGKFFNPMLSADRSDIVGKLLELK